MMNKCAGNMYPWITHTWNPIRGKCPHECVYCYMKRFPVGDMRLAEKELYVNLGKENIIFVGSSTDMFADTVPKEWISRVLKHCKEYDDNWYLFQSKNPKRFKEFKDDFPKNTTLGTTIETNRDYKISKSPSPARRFMDMPTFTKTMISIEPVMDFDVSMLVQWIKILKPKFISIGADSKGNNLPEPDKEKLNTLISELKKLTDVRLKSNLKRLMR